MLKKQAAENSSEHDKKVFYREAKTMKKTVALMLAIVLMFLQAPVTQAAGFTDVKTSDWFYDEVTALASFGIINGYADGSFKPNDPVKRGEFMKMLASATEYLYTTTPSKGIHWSEQYWNMLNETLVLEVTETRADDSQFAYPLISLSYAELEKTINRYEMAYMINRIMYMVKYESPMVLKNDSDSYANHISDYNTMQQAYQGAVEQVFSKGIITGYENKSFGGDNVLNRAEAATVILRYLLTRERIVQPFAVERQVEKPEPGFTSFALRYRNMSDAERRTALFGDPNKTYFANATEAAPYMVSIQVPIWKLDSKGNKYSSTAYLTVHKLVEAEIKAIFNEIFNSPEKFPMNAIGGARFTDSLRHSWGCAIDINPNENYYVNYKTGQTVGSFCYKNGSSPYCITPDSSVVQAFARYGWGWGGQGWSTAVDYMHFSILPSGG